MSSPQVLLKGPSEAELVRLPGFARKLCKLLTEAGGGAGEQGDADKQPDRQDEDEGRQEAPMRASKHTRSLRKRYAHVQPYFLCHDQICIVNVTQHWAIKAI